MTARLPKAAATANLEREKKIEGKKGMRGIAESRSTIKGWIESRSEPN